jgi:NAD(P)-dependent dehydrogenase (short-subunit alcohol dehydrogenase family)
MAGLRLQGQVAVVTGASSGIGRALARALAAEGAAVVGGARRFPAAPGVSPRAGQVAEVHLDMGQEAEVRALFAALPRVDVLINNAGAFHTGPLVDFAIDKLRELLDVHVIGAFVAAQEALRRMRDQAPRAAGGRGHIVFVSSSAAFASFRGSAGYTAAKEAQKGMARVLVEEARPHEVRVTGLFPGATDTAAWSGSGLDPGRMMRPEALAALVIEILVRPELSVELLAVNPPGGAL